MRVTITPKLMTEGAIKEVDDAIKVFSSSLGVQLGATKVERKIYLLSASVTIDFVLPKETVAIVLDGYKEAGAISHYSIHEEGEL